MCAAARFCRGIPFRYFFRGSREIPCRMIWSILSVPRFGEQQNGARLSRWESEKNMIYEGRSSGVGKDGMIYSVKPEYRTVCCILSFGGYRVIIYTFRDAFRC